MNKEQQILSNIEKRLKTIMIGGLSRFENSFGYLWNIDGDPQNHQQQMLSDKWEDTRTDLLNHGNHQIRQAMNDLLDYIQYKNKYSNSYHFVIKNSENNNPNNDTRR